MKNKYAINKVNICVFEFSGDSFVRPCLDKYPDLRLCVIDNEENIAIDVEHKLKYDYL